MMGRYFFLSFVDLIAQLDESALDMKKMIKGLTEYTNFVRNSPIDERLFYPLIIFFNSQVTSLPQCQKLVYELLQYIHDNDRSVWPIEVPKNPEEKGWYFHFNEVALFFNVNLPLYEKNKSRKVSEYITFVVNPIENFKVVAPEVNGKRKASIMIRERVKKYNQTQDVPVTLSLGATNPDWKQYMHEESDLVIPAVCPLKIKD